MSQQSRRRSESGVIQSKLSELHLATVYGTEAFVQLRDEGELDQESWLDLFQKGHEKLNEPIRSEAGTFKLESSGSDRIRVIEYLVSDDTDRERIVSGLQELADYSKRVKGGDIPELNDKIDLAKEVRDLLEKYQRE